MYQTVKNVQQQIDQFLSEFYEFSETVSRVLVILSRDTFKNIGELVKNLNF